jgi:hypothetical protein
MKNEIIRIGQIGIRFLLDAVQKVVFPVLLAAGTLLGSTTNSKMHQNRYALRDSE